MYGPFLNMHRITRPPPPECASGRTHSSRVGCPHIALRRTEILKRNNYYYLFVHVLLTLSSCSVAFFV